MRNWCNQRRCTNCAEAEMFACNDCGDVFCKAHLYDDGEGGGGNDDCSPGGLMCMPCVGAHYDQ